VRNYLYISDSKVDTYLGQFDNSEKRSIAGRLGIHVGVLQASAEVKQLPVTNRIHRLDAVENHIRTQGTVGGLDDETPWVEATMEMTGAYFPEAPDVMFFFRSDRERFAGIVGSRHHIIGNVRAIEMTSSISHLGTLLASLEPVLNKYAYMVTKSDSALQHQLEVGVSRSSLHASSWVPVMMQVEEQFRDEQTQRLSFLARRLVKDEIRGGARKYTLATPLYVTADDVYEP